MLAKVSASWILGKWPGFDQFKWFLPGVGSSSSRICAEFPQKNDLTQLLMAHRRLPILCDSNFRGKNSGSTASDR